MSFIAKADAAVETAIANDGFFPSINPVDARDAMRMDGTVTAERLRNSLIDAISSVNDELAVWKAAQIAAGHATLTAVPASTVDAISAHLHRYKRAVYAMSKANLIERYRDFDSTNAGNKKADQMENPIDDLRRDARWAISDILDIGRTTVELI